MATTWSLNRSDARAVMLAAQGLTQPLGEELSKIHNATGFVRTLGGIDVYLALRARSSGLSRRELDDVVVANEAQVVLAARGCIYLVERSQVGVALRLAESLSRSRAERDHKKVGIEPGELEALVDTIVSVLAEDGPTTTNALRKASGNKRVLDDVLKSVSRGLEHQDRDDITMLMLPPTQWTTYIMLRTHL